MPELTPNYNFKKPIFSEEAADIRTINENFDIADEEIKKVNDSIENLESNKQNKEDSTLKTVVKTIVGAINELYDELIKKATKTQLGRIKVGNNLTVDEDGTLHGNPEYTHPSGNGNNHIPVNGASGNFLKWLSSGAAQWVNITWSDITGKPSSFTPSAHTHTKANITDFPTSMKNPSALTISLNGTSQGAYDGAAAKNINITPTSIGAEPAFSKNGAFNKPFGTSSNTVLEGAKLAEILGLTYGGSLNNSNTKTLNYAYYDNTTKKVYKCIKSTTLNYADSSCFEAISNNDLLSKFQNLNTYEEVVLYSSKITSIGNITLNDSINNYDMISVIWDKSGKIGEQIQTVSRVKTVYNGKYQLVHFPEIVNIQFTTTDFKTINIDHLGTYILKIVGIKFKY